MINIYEIENSKLQDAKKVLEKPELDQTGKFVEINEFGRNGYTMRDAKSLGLNKNVSYIYVEANEEFFKKNEAKIKDFAKKISGKEYDEAKKKIEEEQANSAFGVGAVFGDL